ncbi:MAG: hypothetical protein AAF988_07765 [Pseudomonadota bacterium]
MPSLQIRNIDESLLASLKVFATASGKRGVETYVRELLKKHVAQPKKRFLDDIEKRHADFERKYGKLKTTSEDLLREDRDA